MKRCPICEKDVPPERRKLCSKACSDESQRRRCKKRYHERREEYVQVAHQWKIDNPKRYFLNQIKNRCRRTGEPFNLTLEDIEIPVLCPMLGVPLEWDTDTPSRSPNKPSVDKIDPSQGYVKGNIHVISWRANRLKNDATLEEMVLLGQWAEKQHD